MEGWRPPSRTLLSLSGVKVFTYGTVSAMPCMYEGQISLHVTSKNNELTQRQDYYTMPLMLHLHLHRCLFAQTRSQPH